MTTQTFSRQVHFIWWLWAIDNSCSRRLDFNHCVSGAYFIFNQCVPGAYFIFNWHVPSAYFIFNWHVPGAYFISTSLCLVHTLFQPVPAWCILYFQLVCACCILYFQTVCLVHRYFIFNQCMPGPYFISASVCLVHTLLSTSVCLVLHPTTRSWQFPMCLYSLVEYIEVCSEDQQLIDMIREMENYSEQCRALQEAMSLGRGHVPSMPCTQQVGSHWCQKWDFMLDSASLDSSSARSFKQRKQSICWTCTSSDDSKSQVCKLVRPLGQMAVADTVVRSRPTQHVPMARLYSQVVELWNCSLKAFLVVVVFHSVWLYSLAENIHNVYEIGCIHTVDRAVFPRHQQLTRWQSSHPPWDAVPAAGAGLTGTWPTVFWKSGCCCCWWWWWSPEGNTEPCRRWQTLGTCQAESCRLWLASGAEICIAIAGRQPGEWSALVEHGL